MKFIVTGDLQYGTYDGVLKEQSGKANESEKIRKYCSAKGIDVVLVCGDLCDHGYGRFCCSTDPDETSAFINEYYKPLKNTGTRVMCCRGNHDTYNGIPIESWQPVRKFIVSEYGDIKYSNVYGGVRFISCDIYPTEQIRNWLSLTSEPTVLFWHYNLSGQYSEWWSDADKNSLFNIIKDKNILCICTGHLHSTEQRYWNGIKEISGSGSTVMLCEYTPDLGLSCKEISLA